MLQKLRKLRTNENILIAVDVLLHSKSSFMSIFLMAFMMRASLRSAPDTFIEYNLLRYVLMGVLSELLMKHISRHPLAAWRTSMMFSVAQIVALILIPQDSWFFVPAVATGSALESVLYWRPKMYFDSTEVTPDRRLRFKGIGQIFIELAKIVMPVILGLAITNSSYKSAGNIILIISLVQLFLSLLFRPTVKARKTAHSTKYMLGLIRSHPTLRRMLSLQFLRGLLTTSAAYLVISQIHLYNNFDSDMGLGIFTSVASVVSIFLISVYTALAHHKNLQKTIIYTIAPAAFLLPFIAYIFPNDGMISIVLFIFAQSIIDSFTSSVLSIARLQEITQKHIDEPTARLQMETISEIFLTLGRIVSWGILLAFCMNGLNRHILIIAIAEGLLFYPAVQLMLPASMRRRK